MAPDTKGRLGVLCSDRGFRRGNLGNLVFLVVMIWILGYDNSSEVCRLFENSVKLVPFRIRGLVM